MLDHSDLLQMWRYTGCQANSPRRTPVESQWFRLSSIDRKEHTYYVDRKEGVVDLVEGILYIVSIYLFGDLTPKQLNRLKDSVSTELRQMLSTELLTTTATTKFMMSRNRTILTSPLTLESTFACDNAHQYSVSISHEEKLLTSNARMRGTARITR